MKIVTWNIQAGGGRRVPDLASRLLRDSPDVVVLGEYCHHRPGRELAWVLESKGLVFQQPASTNPSDRGILLASRLPFEVESFPEWPDSAEHRLVAARFEKIRILATYFPSSPPHIARMFDPCIEATPRLQGFPTLLVGDLNAGSNPEDAEGRALTAGEKFDRMLELGWVDLWRSQHPTAREFTWYSRSAGNGFRLDHALLIGGDMITADCRYDHRVREAGLSDHSLLTIGLKM